MASTEYWIDQAAQILRDGGLVAFPTETVYGLGADATNEEAVKRLFAAKGRPATNPLIVHIAEIDQLKSVAQNIPKAAYQLAEQFWPGPLTQVLEKTDRISNLVTAGGRTVGVRIPNHPIATQLLDQVQLPIAAPSANRSEGISPTCAEHVLACLGDSIDLILDGGVCEVGIESTVVSLVSCPPRLLRPGIILWSEIAPYVVSEGAMNSGIEQPIEITLSPGTMPRHYAPRTKLKISNDLIRDLHNATDTVAVLAYQPVTQQHSSIHYLLPCDPAGYAHSLYAALHELDELGVDEILVQAVPDNPEWDAIRDRLQRAAG